MASMIFLILWLLILWGIFIRGYSCCVIIDFSSLWN